MKTALTLSFALVVLAMLSSTGQAIEDFAWSCIDNQSSGVTGVAAADFDGDGDIDVITATYASTYTGLVTGYENNGFNQFSEFQIASGFFQLRRMDKGDLDGDGNMDLVIAAAGSGGMYELENMGDMRFSIHTIDDVHGYGDLEIADLDGDRDLDIVVTESGMAGSGLSCWQNQGNGSFVERILTSPQQHWIAFDVTDFNGDGDTDIVGYYLGDILWLENNGNLTFTESWIGSPPQEVPLDVTTGDLNRDGYQDVVVGLEEDLLWYVNHDNQSFTMDTITSAVVDPYYLRVQDLDNDGWQDVIATSLPWTDFMWYENFAGLYFDTRLLIWDTNGITPYDLADFNADGRMDIATVAFYNPQSGWLQPVGWGANNLHSTVKLAFEGPNEPVIIPPLGGSFDYWRFLSNCTQETLRCDYWIIAESDENPDILVQLVLNHPLSPDTTIVQLVTQSVPPMSRPGEYFYHGYIGRYPDTILDYTDQIIVIIESDSADQTASEILPKSQSPILCRSLPNPFNPSTVVRFELQDASYVSLKVYDISGRLVATLVEGMREAGVHEVTFDGAGLPSGIYIYRITAGSWSSSEKMILLK